MVELLAKAGASVDIQTKVGAVYSIESCEEVSYQAAYHTCGV